MNEDPRNILLMKETSYKTGTCERLNRVEVKSQKGKENRYRVGRYRDMKNYNNASELGCFRMQSAFLLLSHFVLVATSSEKAMALYSSTLDWKLPWTEGPGRLQSMGSLRVGHDWATSLSLFTFMHWRRKWQPTPVFLPGESQGWRSLVGCRLWGRTELDTTEVTQQQQQQQQQQLSGVGGTTPVYARRKGDFKRLSGWSVITTMVMGKKLKPRHLAQNLSCHSAVSSLSLALWLLDTLHLQETITNLQWCNKNYIIVFNC